MKRMKYDKSDLQDTGRAAKWAAKQSGNVVYVLATAYGWAITSDKPFQSCLATDGDKVWEAGNYSQNLGERR